MVNVGTGFRVYVYEEDGTLTRIPHTDYVRLWNGIPSKRLQRFAREEIRVAHTGVELRNRQVMDVTFVEFQKFRIDEDGQWPEAEKERHWRLAADSVDWSFLSEKRNRGNVCQEETGQRIPVGANSRGSQSLAGCHILRAGFGIDEAYSLTSSIRIGYRSANQHVSGISCRVIWMILRFTSLRQRPRGPFRQKAREWLDVLFDAGHFQS